MESEIRKVIIDTIHTFGLTHVDFVVEHPADMSHGDYATNVAMVYAKQMGKNPREIAEQFRVALTDKIPHVVAIEIAGPGFINFHLGRDFFSEKIASIHTNPEQWGTHTTLQKEEIIFEYTSPNLFKPLHIGNLVGNIVGESISRLFEMGGARVYRVNYPSDIGLTVAKGVWGIKKSGTDPHDILQIGEAYRIGNTAYESDPEAKQEIEAVNRALYAGTDASLNEIRRIGIETSLARLRELCRMLGTQFNFELFESEVSTVGVETVRAHVGTVFEESEGAVIYRGEQHGLHTRVFLNSQGLPTYEAKDIGNFVLKQKKYPHWTQYFVVTGGEQREYFKVLIVALREVFEDTKDKIIENIATGFLTLTTGKMSSRKGNVLTGESILAEVQEEVLKKAEYGRAPDVYLLAEMVAVGAIKYQILRQSVGSDIVFDKARALSLEGDSGPYLMYTHARIISVLEKARVHAIPDTYTQIPETSYLIERYLYQFPEVIERCTKERSVQYLVTYLTELGGQFNTFYAHEKIVDMNDIYAPYKVALTQAVQKTLARGLWVLGIQAPEKM